MTEKELNDLKRHHNALQDEGRALYKRLEALWSGCDALQRQIAAEEGDAYAPIPLLFGAGFWVDDESPDRRHQRPAA
jgi:hypothetical protein